MRPLGSAYPGGWCIGSGSDTIFNSIVPERFKLSNDPRIEKKMPDFVRLYLNPREHALVLCLETRNQIQLPLSCVVGVACRGVRHTTTNASTAPKRWSRPSTNGLRLESETHSVHMTRSAKVILDRCIVVKTYLRGD